MSRFVDLMAQRLASSHVKVTENCTYWKPTIVGSSDKEVSGSVTSPNIESIWVGRALNQYFIQNRIAETSSSTLWKCFDILENRFLCIKLYYITSCKNERSVRFFRDETEVITLLDKVIDEILYHSSLQSCSGVTKVKEVIVDFEGDQLYLVMHYYPSQLMYYDFGSNSYCAPYSDKSCTKYLYKEEWSKEIVKELVHTLEYFHENGVIHKDIKPDNILLSKVYSEMFYPLETSETSENDNFNCDYNRDDDDDYSNNQGNISSADLEEVLSRNEEFRCSEIVSFKFNKIKGCVPMEFKRAGFPYRFCNDFDFFLTSWDDSEMVCDFNHFENREGEYSVGRNSLMFATHISKKSKEESRGLLEYFIKECSPTFYKVNRNFRSCGSGGGFAPIKNNSHSEKQEELEQEEEKEPSNLVLLTDFGVTSLAEEDDESGSLVIFDSEGTTSFTSPESLMYNEGSVPAEAREVFSLGVTLYCMTYGRLPYSGTNGIEMLINILETPLVFHPFRPISEELKALLTSMLHKDHKKRINLKDILKHPWMNS